jgi:hypothetical protein
MDRVIGRIDIDPLAMAHLNSGDVEIDEKE